MFDIGWAELVMIAVVTLLVVGPEELPILLKKLGRVVGSIKQTWRDVESHIEEAAEVQEWKNLQQETKEIILRDNDSIDEPPKP